ncbi:hypothetical protein VaNZ11_013254, partial [Volvox africanus]
MAIAEILRLGTDTLLLVLQHLDAESLAKLCCTCLILKNAAETPALWRALANERWYRVHAARFSQPHAKPKGLANTKANAQPGADNSVDWKSLFASGNGWEPPRLRHTGKLYRSGIRALQPLYHQPNDIAGDHPNSNNSGVDGWLLALGRDAGVDIWHFSSAAFSDGGSDTGGTSHRSSGPASANGASGCNVMSSSSSSSTAKRYIQPADSSPTGLPGSSSRLRGGDCNSGGETDAGQPDRTCRRDIQLTGGNCRPNGGVDTPAPASAPAAAPVLLDSLQIPNGARSVAWIRAASGDCHRHPGERGHLSFSECAKEVGSVTCSVQRYASKAGDKFAAIGTGRPGRFAPGAGASASTSTSTSTKQNSLGSSTDSGVPTRTYTLAIGSRRGEVQWYQYDLFGNCGTSWRRGGRFGEACSAGALRLLNTTTCGSSAPLAELHLLPASGEIARGMAVASKVGAAAAAPAVAAPAPATTLGVGGGGLLAALQRADSALDWDSSRNAVQIYDVATQRHLSTVHDPFESHQLVCCCPVHGTCADGVSIGGSTTAAADPHVLLVGSVHGAICWHCARCNLPSLCSHKPRSATAALYTLDVRCGLTQRFGVQHCSLYPRLATAREHYVFTSHAGTALEVYDRRAMSVPLYTRSRMPWVPSGELLAAEMEGGEIGTEQEAEQEAAERREEEEDEEDGQYSDEEDGPMSSHFAESKFPAWSNRASAAQNRHQALWLESDGDVLLGRSDNGTLWLWDLSTTLGWAGGPDRSGLWHWIYENGPLEMVDEELDGAGSRCADTWPRGLPSRSQDREVAALNAAALDEAEMALKVSGEAGGSAGRRAAATRAPGEPICLGSVVCHSGTPVCSLATGASTAFFSLGMW